ncbi:MAG TPA: CpsD/CapB family tyrosine-protein kinase [Candidatus Acidoferrales bacterium]|nr:CpsD/CapB family tyrosine-protein kinase [Candidatus Acidoferrales bacterium]
MSRIHEALKRAEQEKAAGQPTPANEATVEHAVKSSVIETAPPPVKVSTKAVFPALNTPHLPIAAEPVAHDVKFDELWAKCQKKEWRPDPNVIVFGTSSPFVPGAEQFRTLRSRLYRMRESQPLQTILISSAIPAEGKTVVSSNLAFALVRQQGSRVLLIDADLRSPRVHMLLGAPAAPGMADYLQNTANEFQITQRSGEEGLCFIPAGNHVTHPSELISSGRMKEFLDRMKPAFDWIIIDSPPALPVADASVLGGLVDGVLFVVRANSTPSEASQKACKELRDAHILGVVLNTAEESEGYNSYYTSAYGNPQAKDREKK